MARVQLASFGRRDDVRTFGHGRIDLASAPTCDLVDGSGLAFEDRGRHELKGIIGPREVFALTEA